MKLRWTMLAALLGLSMGCSSPSSPSNTGTPVSIVNGAQNLKSTAFTPNPVVIAVGGTVTWRNNDATTHTATDDKGAFNSGSISPGASFSHTFSTAGTFTYNCTIHPNMVGTVTVQ